MKFIKILPAAASIIALTATIAFARDQKETEEIEPFRIKVEMRDSTDNIDKIAALAIPVSVDSRNEKIYHVEIERGNKTSVVSIDAYSGRILDNTEIPAKKS